MRSDRNNPKIEISDIFAAVFPAESERHLSADQSRVVRAIKRCRTKDLGGHINRCQSCGHEEQSYNSCLNRHCPKCQGSEAFRWVQERQEELLPVPYFHLVFTLPETLRELCFQNKRICYDLILKASSEALKTAVKTKYGTQAGIISILHTWNQTMDFHPHAHQIVPAVGLTPEKKAIILGKKNFLISVRVLSKLWRGKFIYYLKKAYHQKKLKFFNDLTCLANPANFEHLISKSAKHDWVVYSKAPFAGPERLLKYLANYTHRICISNKRVLSHTKDEIRIIARGIKQKHKKRIIKLRPQEFVRRYLLHIIPKNLRRIRYQGFLYNRKRKEHIQLIRNQITQAITPVADKPHPQACPNCKTGIMQYKPLINLHRFSRRQPATSILKPPVSNIFALDSPPSYYVH